MAGKNTCWDCKYNTLKLKILVPQNYSIQDYVHSTDNLCSNIVAIVKEKQGQYAIWFRRFDELKRMSFKMVHICKFRIEGEKQPCLKHEPTMEQKVISNTIYAKISAPDMSKIILPKLKPSIFISKIAHRTISQN